MNPVISFRGVRFVYPQEDVAILDDVTLDVPEGSFVLVTGPTGAGKSTFLRAVNGLVPHFSGGTFSGEVTVRGRSTVEASPRDLADEVAFVPQDPDASFVVDRVEDELAYAMENLGVPPNSMRRRVEETLDLLALAHLRDRSVRSLSGGERQRVAIAAALTPGPRILVLDEPTSQLDPQGAEDVLAALQRLVHDLGMTVLCAEHRLERVAGFADLAIGCGGGRFVVGEPHDIVDRFASGPPVARLGRLAGWSPVPLTVREARRNRPAAIPPPEPVRSAELGGMLLRGRSLSASYGDGPSVFSDVSIELAGGEITALMGRNGAGKTTLLRSLVGVHERDGGTVMVGNEPPHPGHNIALCPQTPGSILFAETVLDEVKATVSWSASGADPDAILAALGSSDRATRHPRDLSAGERSLVATAATVATDAKVLLLDEPTRGLDLVAKDKLIAYLRSFTGGGGAVLFATHDVEFVAELATRVVMLADGEVIADGSPADVLGDSPVFAPQMARVFGPGWLTPEQVHAALFSDQASLR